jgi:ribosomal-protein-alanine N-acetyltransferase
MKDPEMHTWTGNTVPNNPNETKEMLQHYKELDHIIAWSVILKSTQEMIGTYWLAVPISNEEGVMVTGDAQRIARKCWRTGITSQVRKLAYDYAFFRLGVDEIHASAWKANTNSCRSMEKAGFTLLEQRERLFSKYEKVMTENIYILRKKDWFSKEN